MCISFCIIYVPGLFPFAKGLMKGRGGRGRRELLVGNNSGNSKQDFLHPDIVTCESSAVRLVSAQYFLALLSDCFKADHVEISRQCDPAYTANMFMDLLSEQPNCLMTFGGACSDVTEILAKMSAYRHLAQVYY